MPNDQARRKSDWLNPKKPTTAFLVGAFVIPSLPPYPLTA